jgi:hypothetical protein
MTAVVVAVGNAAVAGQQYGALPAGYSFQPSAAPVQAQGAPMPPPVPGGGGSAGSYGTRSSAGAFGGP